mgnify:FL=1
MLHHLLETYLRLFGQWLVGLLALQFLVTIAGLSLPRLNADIIDIGVVAGDTDYILRAGSRRGLAGAVVAGHAGAVLPPSGDRAAGLDDERYVSLVR